VISTFSINSLRCGYCCKVIAHCNRSRDPCKASLPSLATCTSNVSSYGQFTFLRRPYLQLFHLFGVEMKKTRNIQRSNSIGLSCSASTPNGRYVVLLLLLLIFAIHTFICRASIPKMDKKTATPMGALKAQIIRIHCVEI